MVASIIRTAFAQPEREDIHTQFADVTTMLGRYHPKAPAMLDDAQHDLAAFAAFPQRYWQQIWSTNPLERVNKEIKRRTDVVGDFPIPAALLRLADAVLVEPPDEGKARDRRYVSESSMLELTTMTDPTVTIEEMIELPVLVERSAGRISGACEGAVKVRIRLSSGFAGNDLLRRTIDRLFLE